MSDVEDKHLSSYHRNVKGLPSTLENILDIALLGRAGSHKDKEPSA